MNPLDACWAVLKAPVDPKKFAFEEKQRALDKKRREKAAEAAAARNQTSLDNWTEGE